MQGIREAPLFSRAAECALQAATYICLNASEGRPVLSSEIAEQLVLPLAFTRKSLRALVTAGILLSARGKSGGFVLARPPETISVMEIVAALDSPPLKEGTCLLGQNECGGENPCALHNYWSRVISGLKTKLQATSLRDLARHQRSASAFLRRPR